MFTKDELSLLRQWHNYIADVNSSYLGNNDFELYKKIGHELNRLELQERANTVIEWCDDNIENQTQVTPFAVQIRDLLEGS